MLNINLMFQYRKLGLKPQTTLEKSTLNKSIKRHFKSSNIDNFNSYFTLFSLRNLNNKTFNNKKQILKIFKKKKNITFNGSIYKCLIKSRGKKYNVDIFIKETPVINPILFYINYDINLNTNYNYKNYIINNLLFSQNNSSNIELFVNYILSKLVELNITLHFPYFYGFNIVTMNKFTIENDHSITNYVIDKNIKYKMYKNNNIERYDIPTILIYTEKLCNTLYNYIKYKDIILECEWSSYIFQVISSLSIIQKYFNLYHNDLHISNIMFVYTPNKYIYYSYNNKYYRIPTYNKILKIIDWGRSTYDFNNYKGENNVFSLQGDVFGQYIYKKINNIGKKEIQLNPHFDLAIFAYNIIIEPTFPKKGGLYNLVFSWLNNSKINKNTNMFLIYKHLSTNANNSIPKYQIEKDIFKKFIIKKNKISLKSKIYPLD